MCVCEKKLLHTHQLRIYLFEVSLLFLFFMANVLVNDIFPSLIFLLCFSDSV